eukprot:498127-Pyramimonas_sp.AAC.1
MPRTLTTLRDCLGRLFGSVWSLLQFIGNCSASHGPINTITTTTTSTMTTSTTTTTATAATTTTTTSSTTAIS